MFDQGVSCRKPGSQVVLAVVWEIATAVELEVKGPDDARADSSG